MTFGPIGAGRLCNIQPYENDIIRKVESSAAFSCHGILEGGAHSSGFGRDVAFLKNEIVSTRIDALAYESVVSRDQNKGSILLNNATFCLQQLQGLWLRCTMHVT